jgi:sulfide:quinone oxidoreductase
MSDFRAVTPLFSVAPQLTEAAFAEAATAGFKTIILNRPDGEAADQVSAKDARAAAEAAGLAFHAIPFSGQPTLQQVEATQELLGRVEAPVLAYCRSGTRSVTVWALAQARAKAMEPSAIIAAARNAGYDLSPMQPILQRLATE